MEVIKVNSLFLLSINDRSEEMEEEASSDEFEHREDLETYNPNDFIVPCPRRLPLLPTVFGHGILQYLSHKMDTTHAMDAATGIRRIRCHKLYETYDLGESIWEFTDSLGVVIFGVMISQVKSKPATNNNLNIIQTQK
jgi:hypothetical protein